MNSHLATYAEKLPQTKAAVSKVINFSCVDGPGSRLVIFLQGCNYNCLNCHNPQTIDLCDNCGGCISSCPVQALSWADNSTSSSVKWDTDLCIHCDTCLSICPKQSTPKTYHYSVADMLLLIRKNSLFINGITISGGEATLQLNFIKSLFEAVKTAPDLQHLSCMVDSNGSLSESGWQKLLPFIDGAMIDLKAWQQATHLWITGRDHHRVFRSLALLAAEHKLYEVRLLHIPGKTDFESEIDALADYLKKLPPAVRIKLNAFQNHGVTTEAKTWKACTEQDIKQLAGQLSQRGVGPLILPAVYI
ncbi:YjjW family glycine radical enzyme activase [Psychromonas aquimarina]|uniref:YjjW family glycine radical enzyme activase n=1 Tax=Psychromonas aquimarina TaxID=444919 RepID=UPI00056AF78E|nr:YjjW family glycine radical enzyme activase [Psychromonas aquimarina]